MYFMVRVKVRVRVNVNPNPNPLCWLRPMGYSLDEGILRPSGVVPLRHLRHVPPQTVWRLWLIVYRTELKVSLCA